MSIEFDQRDKQLIRGALEEAGLQATASDVRYVADAVRAAFDQQFQDEVTYLLWSLRDSGALVASEVVGHEL